MSWEQICSVCGKTRREHKLGYSAYGCSFHAGSGETGGTNESTAATWKGFAEQLFPNSRNLSAEEAREIDQVILKSATPIGLMEGVVVGYNGQVTRIEVPGRQLPSGTRVLVSPGGEIEQLKEALAVARPQVDWMTQRIIDAALAATTTPNRPKAGGE